MRLVESHWEGKTAYIASLRDITERKLAEQNERRLIREQSARAAAEQLARRLRFLLDSTTQLSSSLDFDDTLHALARLCVSELADWAIVYCVDHDGHPRRLVINHRDPSKSPLVEELREVFTGHNGPHPVLDLFTTRRSRMVEQVDDRFLESICRNSREIQLARSLGIESLVLVPMIARGHPLGAVALVSGDPERPFTDADLALAEDIAARAALAIDNARLYGEEQRATKTKIDLLAVVSHDLRTPLNAIVGYADLMAMGIPEQLAAGSRQHLERIRTSARHLLYLMNELLAFARLDAGHEELHLQDIDVRDVMGEVSTLMEPLAGERGLGFVVEKPSEPLHLRTDPDKLRQVLLNIIGNAVKYTPSGEVRVQLSGSSSRALVRVSDTGIGIERAHIQRIFDPFWQADPTQRSRNGGTGLGLSIVRRLIDLLGGEANVDSDVGRGTTFIVSLPNHTQYASPASDSTSLHAH
jgi:signal transduction histidine kinase